MSLDFNYARVENQDALFRVSDGTAMDEEKGKSYMTGEFNYIIWAGLTVGLGDVTEKNVEKWSERCYALSLAKSPIGSFFEKGEDGKSIHRDLTPTVEDMKKYIGLGTNCSRLTDKQFYKKIGELVERQAQAHVSLQNHKSTK